MCVANVVGRQSTVDGAFGASGENAVKLVELDLWNGFDDVTLPVRSSAVVDVTASSLNVVRVNSLTAQASPITYVCPFLLTEELLPVTSVLIQGKCNALDA